MLVREFRALEELKERGYRFNEGGELSSLKNKALIHKGLYGGLRKIKLLFIFASRIRKGENSVESVEDEDFRQFLRALEDTGILKVYSEKGMVEVLQREVFSSSNIFRKRMFTLFVGLTIYRTMGKMGMPFRIIFDIQKDEVKYFDTGLITHKKCLFFVTGKKERSINLSVPSEVYYLRLPREVRRSSKGSQALNVFKLKPLIERTYGGKHGKEHNL